MSIEAVLEKKVALLYGSQASSIDGESLRAKLGPELMPPWLFSILKKYPLSGVCFSLSEEDDQSEYGVELMWLMPDQIIEEALLTFPGKSVLKLHYLPVGSCLSGSGDPYFLRLKGNSDNPAVVRVRHDMVPESGDYPEDKIEIVCDHLSDFFEKVKIE